MSNVLDSAGCGELPDGSIVERIRGGETQLYEILIRRHNQRLFRIARAILGEVEDVEDVMQETYLRAYAALSKFEGRALFSTWLTRILINCARERLRSRSRQLEVRLDSLDDLAEGEIAESATEKVERVVFEQEARRLIEAAIDLLPSSYRLVFVMREVEGLSVTETAACLGLSRVNVKVRHHRARRLLRERLGRALPEITPYPFDGVRCDRITRRVCAKLAGEAGSRFRVGPRGHSDERFVG